MIVRKRSSRGLSTLGQFTEKQMKQLLMALAAKAGLDYDEIIGAYAMRRTKIANDFLTVRKDSAYPTLTCGHSPHFAASVVDEKGKILLIASCRR